ncbi:hypothetical protein ABW21_db0205970 [Orbilia brochopaga]|nr:hypothetical protein ABW21_db0205970 [Drechslerella brochopaga]
MVYTNIALTATFAAVALGAALPPAGNLAKRDHVESLDVFQASNATEQYSRDTDDAWVKVDMKFPMTMFGKSDSTVYFSMNGLISLGKPGNDRLLPSESCTLGSSCLPDNTLALDWTDLYIPPNAGDQSVTWVYHDAVLRPDIREHYHIGWSVCSKTPDATAKPGTCGTAARTFTLNYYKNKPGVFHIRYDSTNKEDFPKNFGVIGVQSFSSSEKLEFELPEKATIPGKPLIIDGVDYGRGTTCIIIDTNTKTVTAPTKEDQC